MFNSSLKPSVPRGLFLLIWFAFGGQVCVGVTEIYYGCLETDLLCICNGIMVYFKHLETYKMIL